MRVQLHFSEKVHSSGWTFPFFNDCQLLHKIRSFRDLTFQRVLFLKKPILKALSTREPDLLRGNQAYVRFTFEALQY